MVECLIYSDIHFKINAKSTLHYVHRTNYNYIVQASHYISLERETILVLLILESRFHFSPAFASLGVEKKDSGIGESLLLLF